MQLTVDFIFGFIMQRMVVTSPHLCPVVNSQIVYELSCIAYYVISFTFIVALRPRRLYTLLGTGDDVVSYYASLLNAAQFKLSEYVSLSFKVQTAVRFYYVAFPC